MATEIWSAGAAYIDGEYMPIQAAKIPITDWAYRRSDVVYDVVSVWDGTFFRLADHLRRFAASAEAFHLTTPSGDELRKILHEVVARSGLREAYVAIDCLRRRPAPGLPYHPRYSGSYILAFAIPYVRLLSPEVAERGPHLIVASTPRIPEASVPAKAKNFHWGDMTRALFEAAEAGGDVPILLDAEGDVTEGPGFNVFCVTDGIVATPNRNVLEGITRQSAIELCEGVGIECQVRAVPVGEFRGADEVFITSTAGGIMPIVRVDDRILGNGRPGPIFDRIHNLYWAKRRAGWHAEPVTYCY